MSESVIRSNDPGSVWEPIKIAGKRLVSLVNSVPLAVRYLLLGTALIMFLHGYFQRDLCIILASRVVLLQGCASMSIAFVCILAAFGMGWLSLANGGLQCGVCLAAMSSALAAIALFLLPYTLHNNPAIRALVIVSVAGIVVRAWMMHRKARRVEGREWGVLKDVLLPLWNIAVIVGMVTCLSWNWTGGTLRFEVERPTSIAESEARADRVAGCLRDDSYKAMSPEEKIGLLEDIVSVNCAYLNVEKPPTIVITSCSDPVAGFYVGKDNTIAFDYRILSDRDTGEVFMIVSHEVYHCFQWECAVRGSAPPDARRSGGFFTEPGEDVFQRWGFEFEHYNSYPSEEYYDQSCERYAYGYSELFLALTRRSMNKDGGNVLTDDRSMYELISIS